MKLGCVFCEVGSASLLPQMNFELPNDIRNQNKTKCLIYKQNVNTINYSAIFVASSPRRGASRSDLCCTQYHGMITAHSLETALAALVHILKC
jgi:hypothetical protein